MRKIAPRFDAALLILIVGFGFSLAANLLWTWPGGVVRILGGALASLALPGAIHLWDKIPLPPPLTFRVWKLTVRIPVMRLLRALTMTGIAGMAAFTTFSHASALLVAHGEDPLLATLYPVMTELLVVMGVLARKTAEPPARPAQKPRPRRDDQVSAPAVAAPKPAVTSIDQPRNRRAVGLAYARDNWPVSGTKIAAKAGVSKAEGDRIRAAVKGEKERAS
jgi:hypothetical protein